MIRRDSGNCLICAFGDHFGRDFSGVLLGTQPCHLSQKPGVGRTAARTLLRPPKLGVHVRLVVVM